MNLDSTSNSRPARPNRWLPWLVLAAAGAAAAALIATRPQHTPVTVAERAWLVSVEPAVIAGYRPSVTLYGRVESLWSSELPAGVAADVREVGVVEGETVTRGQLLVRLDDRDARLMLAQREAELAQAEARIAAEKRRHAADLEALPREQQLYELTRSEVARLQDLVNSKAGAQSQLDTARQAAERQAIALSARRQQVDDHTARLAEVEAARARALALRDQALLELERCEVLAPFNGRITRVMVAPGRRVRVGDPLLSLFDTDALILRAQLPSRHLPAIRAAMRDGSPLMVNGEIDGMTITGRLRGLAGEAASGTGGVDGLFTVIGDAAGISQGRFVRLELRLPETGGLVAVPHESIYGTDRIYTIDDQNRMRAQRVERVGEWRDADGHTRVLIRAPQLVPGTPVVTTQLPSALDGLLVRVAGGT